MSIYICICLLLQTLMAYILHLQLRYLIVLISLGEITLKTQHSINLSEKAEPVAIQGRKAVGPTWTDWLPKSCRFHLLEGSRCVHFRAVVVILWLSENETYLTML